MRHLVRKHTANASFRDEDPPSLALRGVVRDGRLCCAIQAVRRSARRHPRLYRALTSLLAWDHAGPGSLDCWIDAAILVWSMMDGTERSCSEKDLGIRGGGWNTGQSWCSSFKVAQWTIAQWTITPATPVTHAEESAACIAALLLWRRITSLRPRRMSTTIASPPPPRPVNDDMMI